MHIASCSRHRTDGAGRTPVIARPGRSARTVDSVRFFTIFAPAARHEGRLTAAELKLVSEWLDIGAQYFNDPFAAPLN